MGKTRYPDSVPAGWVGRALALCPGPVVGDG
jgi:hypothetical protein